MIKYLFKVMNIKSKEKIINMINIINNMFKKDNINNDLIFYREYFKTDGYSIENLYKKENIKKILNLFNSDSIYDYDDNIYIESKYKLNYYPFFDLDDNEMLNKFTYEISDNIPYVIFESSSKKYWAIIDTPYFDIDDIFKLKIWNNINDEKYVNIAKHKKWLAIRGLYENANKKPTIIKKNKPDNFSNIFKEFIIKLVQFYNGDGLELSVIRYKDSNLKLKFDRKIKLDALEKIESN